MNTRRAILILVGVALVAVTAIAGPTVFSYLRAEVQNDDIIVRWRSMSEVGVQYYDIERSSEDLPEYRRLERVSAKGGGSTYSFVDNGAFYKPSSGKRFYYRIRAAGTGGELYSPIVEVVHDVSSVKRSWGMIKELFR